MPEATRSCLMHVSCFSATLCKLKLLCLIIFVTFNLLELGAAFQCMECSSLFSVCKHLNLNWSNESGAHFTANVTSTLRGFFSQQISK